MQKIAPLDILFGFTEVVLADTAQGTFKILGEVLEFRAGSDAVFGIAELFVIFIAAS